MFKRITKYIGIVVTIAAFMSVPVSAVQQPAGCNSNRLNLSITRDKITIKQGETLTYTVTVSNLDFGSNLACDIDTATVTVTLPAADGTPTGQVVTLTTTGNYPAGTAVTVVGTVPYVVNVNDDVMDVVAQADIEGVLHDAPVDHTAQISKTIGTTVLADELPPTDEEVAGSGEFPGMPNTATSM